MSSQNARAVDVDARRIVHNSRAHNTKTTYTSSLRSPFFVVVVTPTKHTSYGFFYSSRWWWRHFCISSSSSSTSSSSQRTLPRVSQHKPFGFSSGDPSRSRNTFDASFDVSLSYRPRNSRSSSSSSSRTHPPPPFFSVSAHDRRKSRAIARCLPLSCVLKLACGSCGRFLLLLLLRQEEEEEDVEKTDHQNLLLLLLLLLPFFFSTPFKRGIL